MPRHPLFRGFSKAERSMMSPRVTSGETDYSHKCGAVGHDYPGAGGQTRYCQKVEGHTGKHRGPGGEEWS